MKLFFEILLCAFATFGVYALFARVAVSLLRRDVYSLAVRGDGKNVEEVTALAALLSLRIETDQDLSESVVVLLERDDAALENALLAEGFLVYKRKNK